MRPSITLLDLEERRAIRYKLFGGRVEWGRGTFLLFSMSIVATAALEAALSIAAPYLAVHGRDLTACLVGLFYGHLTGFNPLDFSDLLDPARLSPPGILARWIFLPFLGLVSLGLSLPPLSVQSFLNPLQRGVLAAGAALATVVYGALLLAYPVSRALYGHCPCVPDVRAAWNLTSDLRWGFWLALVVAILNIVLNEFAIGIEAHAVPAAKADCEDKSKEGKNAATTGGASTGGTAATPSTTTAAPAANGTGGAGGVGMPDTAGAGGVGTGGGATTGGAGTGGMGAPGAAGGAGAAGAPSSPIPSDQFPQRLAELGFEARNIGGAYVITPPVDMVKAGPFLMGSDLFRDTNALFDELDQHTMHLGAFQIARYPVTVAEYACFLNATGVGHPAPATWALQNQVGHRDHPVVDVSWDDVIAYVRWLENLEAQAGTTRTWHWRLPTEAQWEKAARGTDGRVYPWSDAFDVTRCNTRESGILATTPVGTYPRGATPRGALDMAGNVWEWTASLHRGYPYLAGDGREPDMVIPMPSLPEPYVLRGGSWRGSWTQARAAYRDKQMPEVTCDDVGFRLVKAPTKAK